MKLQGKKAIVTGGASGIGKAIAFAFLNEGADVAIFDLNLEKTQQVADELTKLTPCKAFAVGCDVGMSDAVATAFDQAEEQLGGLDILVNSAGLIRQAPLVETPEEDWDFIIRNNLKSVFLCSQQAAKRMITQNRGGRIIAISSIHAVLSEPNCGAYTAAKGGIESFCRTIASELAAHKITVNYIRPGATYTELTIPMYTKQVVKSLYERVPLKQIAQASWIANGAVFLASDDACYMTGQDLTIDGGYTMDGSLPGAAYWEGE
ncbi:MAG: SDR family oxidoreductase [Phycisphaeraceae bacterium]|nr:SDR family oxidoreductase [Phycisphaeraceae bacterium]